MAGALTLATVRRLGGDTVCVDQDNRFRTWRMARVDADRPGRRRDRTTLHHCYLVEVDEIDATSQPAEDGKKFKVDPSRLLYALRWLNWDEPPDLDLTLVRDPALWFKDVTTLLLGALNRHDPHLFDAVPLPAG